MATDERKLAGGKRRDALAGAVFGDVEIGGGQTGDRLAVAGR